MGRTSTAPLQLQEALVTLVWEQSYGHVTIDAICEEAGVKKGSFYYFYKSKAQLALAAFDHFWEAEGRPHYDALFSACRSPAQRLDDWLLSGYQKTSEQLRIKGQILGCPFFNIGQETSSIEPEVSAKIREILDHIVCYLTAALRDAKEEGLTDIADPATTARAIFTLIQGSVTQARIQNSLLPVEELPESVARLAGLKLASRKLSLEAA
jgi:TetR/AcrR family transcriptional repressor of nem operon